MTEAVTGNTRRLPSWMLQVNNADKQKKPSNGAEKCSLSEELTKTEAAGSKIKPVIRNSNKFLTQEEEINQQAESLQGCETRQTTKRATRKEKVPSTSSTAFHGATRKLKKRTVEDEETVNESITSRDQHVKSKRPKKKKVNSPEKSDEEISLTVEDLMSIAEEYVSAHNEVQHELLAIREHTLEVNPSSSSISGPLGGISQTGGSNQSSKYISSRCSSLSCEKEGKGRENHTNESFDSNIISTGDVAQDMLNLYLGPFLKKTSCEEQNIRPTESKVLQSVHELNNYVGSCAISEEHIPLTKKKSSLKGKVALFFD